MQTIDTAVQARLFENIILSIISVSGNVEHSDRQKEGENILVMMRFQETVEDILEHFRCSIAPNIQSVITQKDVNAVLDTLTEMANGKEPVVRSHLSWKYFERFSFDNCCTSAVLQDVKMLKKQDVDRNMVDILQTFGLETYFPERISLQKALSIDDHASADPNVKHIPWMILKNLISANSDFREKVLRDFWNPVKVKTSHDDLLEEFFSSDEDDTLQTQTYHPSDVFLAIFLCCDPFLKRLIVTKLSVCQFAVPILFGDFQNNDLVFSTWPINDIVLHGETETMITKKRHSVSFIRIGKGSVASKSKLINEFLRELNEHPTFIHKDCMLGKKNRRNVSNGMVEMTWLIPDQTVPMDSSEVNIREPLNIYNLRGDAQQFDRQLNILLLLSNLMVIVISYDDLQQGQFKSILKKVHSSNNSVILLTNMTSKSEDKISMTQYIAEMNVNKSKTRIISTLEKKRDEIAMLSSTDLKEKLTNNIAKLLSKNVDGIQIQTVRKNLPEGIRSDESKKCAIGRGLSESLLESCKQDGNPDNRKDTFLPLQGKHLWHEISKKEKELKRSKSNVFDKEETILRSIRQLRRNQTDICNKVPRAFSLFVETIVKYMEDEEVLQYFILWFKHMLNNQSRVLSKDLLQKFFHAFKKHESNKDNQEEECKSKAELDKAEDLLADASFGIEHFFREVGQVYEAFMHTKEDFHCEVAFGTLQILKKLPVVVAKLLHLGHSFEIMDGDAANVPQKWVTAVLKEVQSIVGTKRKIVTVSVLGIQSSGKSTLLNTMFGLEFAVSAGRCTRGIYTQLVPVKNIGSIDAEYLLVLDTEGLRAPERAGEKVHHDNEIATLVVGLADVVLLNLKGESIADMANILEIVITGLIRLKQVNKNLILRQSCIFIHQNVSKDAQLQLLQGNRNIVKNLDAMTRDVAIQENIANINNFADVIKFNPTKDIKYIPELFHGSPGMGPINQKYSLEVTDVQKCIVREIAQGIRSVTFENYLLHMKSLWQGIQAEDFIFSFRSILEVKSYGILESEYQRLNWELEELKLEWMNNNIKPRFQSFADSASIANCAQALISECKEVIEIKFEESDKVLQDFVKNSELQEHMEHYIFEKRFSMKAKKEQIEHDILQSIKLEKETCTYKLSSDDILTLKEKQITNTARELAKEFSGNKPTNDEMENEFQKMWTQFLNELASEIPQKTQKEKNAIMKEEIKHILFDLYPKHHGLLKTDLMSYAIDQHLSWPCLSEELLHFEVEPDHVSGKVSIKNVLTLFQTNYKPQARRILGDLSFEIENELDNLRRKENEFNRSQFSTIMKIIVTKFKEVNSRSSEYDFKLTPNLEIPVTLRVARHSFHQFQCMNRNYERKYGLQSRLEIKKPMVHQLFLDTCDKQAEEIIATNSLCNVLKISIEEKLQRELNLKMQREIMQRFNLRKHHLMKEVMEDLAKIGNFDIFMKYINSPETYVQKWLRKRTDEYIFQQNNNSGYSSYTSWLEITIPDIIDKIKDTVRLTTKQSHSKMRSWMQCFQQDIINNLALVLNNASFGLLSDHEIKNFDNFVLSIYKKLSELDTELLKTWKEKNPSDFTWGKENPYDCIFSFLWGCLSKCPWCKEPCQRADANHESGNTVHTCLQHRPAGIGGTSFKPTGEMSIESCNFDVQSTLQRSCGKWCGCPKEECEVYHPYSTYKTYMKDWDIEPLGDMSNSKYWNWFMAKFSEQLANYFKKKQSKIPASWKSLTVEEAVQSLSEIYV
ncbi:Hypothetical predicted protein [Mytilus galloprovincialis]|uniref:VLIG-type G domain-containing protein n=1 Tax=Mytilus galloprovincialis TaxID=29158 RepID=A0A8B6BHC4_MYTGA|nr:Hypothetical predicted protein [Mytilus galloprovincialis]